MKLQRIQYAELNSRQQEIFNFQKVAGLLADFGFNCIKLADDWQGADFLAYHKDGIDTLKVQLKSRLTIDRKYLGRDLYMAFPMKGHWHMVEHRELVRLVGENTNWLNTGSWRERGSYHSRTPNRKLVSALEQYAL